MKIQKNQFLFFGEFWPLMLSNLNRVLCLVILFAPGYSIFASVPAVVTHPFDASLISSFNYTSTPKSLDINQAYGVAFTLRNLYMFGETKFSLRTDLLTESSKTSEGAFSVNVQRLGGREWALLMNPASTELLVGIGLGLGAAQNQVETTIQGEKFKSYGSWEPLWGLMVNAQYQVEFQFVPNLFIELALKKIYANNYSRGERTEVDLGMGIRF
jgi:hypothetical protein